MNAQFAREVAHRLFAQEFRDSNFTFKDSNDQYSPQYLLTPTGAKCNRIFVVGTLVEKENIGTDSEYWRARVVDPTGAFFIYAGQYQPEAAHILAGIEPPAFVAVVGKPSTYTAEDGTVRTSIRPESVHLVDAQTRDRWVLDAARCTMSRIRTMKAGGPDVEKVKEHYPRDVSKYRETALNALRSLRA
ncbi:MAG TPA: DNA-binding protein [Candidatus Methanoperedenaceae archaeon]|nr:DNA-binding protein [Candidatus Methanoperedenaceae archaeon]